MYLVNDKMTSEVEKGRVEACMSLRVRCWVVADKHAEACGM